METYFSMEPNIFKLTLENSVHLKHFTLGSLSNWLMNSCSKNHYFFELKIEHRDFKIPEVYVYREGNHLLSNRVWYYSRKLGFWNLKYRLDLENHTFDFFPKIIGEIPFIYNAYYPMGYEISNILIYEMLKKGFIVLRSAAFLYKGKVVLLIAPSYNGKTTLVRTLESSLKGDGSYIAEDVIFISKDKIIGMPPSIDNFNRSANRGFTVDLSKTCLVARRPDYVIYHTVSSINSCVCDKNIPEFPVLEFYSYFSKSLSSSIMHYENEVKAENLIRTYRDILSQSIVYKITTKGFNSNKFFTYLNEIIK